MIQFLENGIEAFRALAAVIALTITLGGILYVIAEEKKWSSDTRRNAYYGLLTLFAFLALGVLAVTLLRSH
ncbi:hypothetical protein [Azovibrio restrictus]|uniref:hypothetical protein n=1 Tax=Azovibrio restrictus TaxID=146938 RepID=UPI0026E9531A|nr:hypothetical protein [Azovibrio restrictus]MDD3482987.1 hypothetical protein [Azovibrio restrictus]